MSIWVVQDPVLDVFTGTSFQPTGSERCIKTMNVERKSCLTDWEKVQGRRPLRSYRRVKEERRRSSQVGVIFVRGKGVW